MQPSALWTETIAECTRGLHFGVVGFCWVFFGGGVEKKRSYNNHLNTWNKYVTGLIYYSTTHNSVPKISIAFVLYTKLDHFLSAELLKLLLREITFVKSQRNVKVTSKELGRAGVHNGLYLLKLGDIHIFLAGNELNTETHCKLIHSKLIHSHYCNGRPGASK